MSSPHGPELHLDVSTLQRPVLLLEVSTPNGPELHLNVHTALEAYFSTTWTCLFHSDLLSTPHRPNLDVSTPLTVRNYDYRYIIKLLTFAKSRTFATLRKLLNDAKLKKHTRALTNCVVVKNSQ
jgi:hypothetical protein